MPASILTLTDATFDQQVQAAALPVLVDFWAEWCQPCKKIAPVLVDIANELPERIAIAKLNIDENPGAAQRYGVMSIPSLLLFKGGVLVHTTVGAKGKAQLLAELDPHL